jgi:cation transport ATPase
LVGVRVRFTNFAVLLSPIATALAMSLRFVSVIGNARRLKAVRL